MYCDENGLHFDTALYLQLPKWTYSLATASAGVELKIFRVPRLPWRSPQSAQSYKRSTCPKPHHFFPSSQETTSTRNFYYPNPSITLLNHLNISMQEHVRSLLPSISLPTHFHRAKNPMVRSDALLLRAGCQHLAPHVWPWRGGCKSSHVHEALSIAERPTEGARRVCVRNHGHINVCASQPRAKELCCMWWLERFWTTALRI